MGERWRIIGLSEMGVKQEDIAQRFGVNQSVVSRLISKHAATGDVADRPRSGRPKVTTPREDRRIINLARRNRFKPATKIRHEMVRIINHPLSYSTVERRLLRAGYRARRPRKGPLLTAGHRQTRLQWAQTRQNYNIRTWRRYIWSDESRYKLYFADGRARVRRLPHEEFNDECIQARRAFGGGSVMVWAAFTFDHKLDIELINGNMNGVMYRDQILAGSVLPFIQAHPATRWVYQDDNARPHRARIVQQYKQTNGICSVDWPACSCDMAPIENVWDYLQRRVNNVQPGPANLQQLWVILHREWNLIPSVTSKRWCAQWVQDVGRLSVEMVAARITN